MTDATGIGIVGIVGALVLVGSAMLAHRRRGDPIARYAAMWTAIFAAAFVIAMLVKR